MLRSAALWRAVLQRSRSDWPVVLAAWLLLLCATTLLATGALYAETVAAGGVRRALLDSPPDERAIRSRTTAASATDVPALDGPVRAAMEETIGRVGGEVTTILRSGSFASAGVEPDEVDQLTYLAAFGGIEGHATLEEGDWPSPGARELQAALPAAAAEVLGVRVGGSLELVSRLDDSVTVDVVVTGLYRVDPDDAYWAGETQEIEGVQVASPYTTVGPVVMTREDLLAVPGRIEVEWRALPAIEGMEVDDVEPLRVDIGQLDERFRAALPGRQLSLDAPLPQRLAEVGRSVVVGRSGVTLLTIQFAVLAGYAIVLVGGLLLERRRSEVALLRSRGATSLHLLVMALVEGLVLAAAAAALAPPLAAGIVRLLAESGPLAEAGIGRATGITPTSILVAVAAGLAGVVALALPTLGSSVSLSGVRATIGRQAGSTLPQRLGIDLALVAVAAIAIWQLRLYGAPLTRDARGALGVDPLLVAAPAIGLLGGAVLALRLVPRVAELGQRLLERRRGLVAPLGGRQLARRPLRYTRAALLLMLAAGLATFATAHAATWTRSQGDQSAYQAAADLRLTAGDEGPSSLAAAGAYRSLPGVEGATAVAQLDLDLGRNIRGAPLLGVDPEAASRVLATQAGATDAAARAALARLAAEPPGSLPAVIPGRPSRLSVVVDAAITQEVADPPYDGVLPPDYRGITPSLVVEDGERRLHRVAVEPGLLDAEGQRLVADLAAATAGAPSEEGAVAPPTAEPVWPLSLVAVDLGLTVPRGVIAVGTVALRDVTASDATTGEAWTSLGVDPLGQPWRWVRSAAATRTAFEPADDGRIALGLGNTALPPLFAEEPATLRLLALPAEPPEVPVVVGRRFLEATGAEVGESLTATTSGLRLPIRIAGAVDEFPPLDPARPFAIVDAAAVERLRFAATGQVSRPGEWWLDVVDGHSGEIADALGQSAWDTDAIVEREALATSLAADPVSLGIIGALGLGAVAALVFAAIGFLVSATVSITERIGEFALLQALGLSRRQLSVWLSLESAFLLVVGLLAGSALGVLLAWLVLPFATLTETGAPAVPAPIVVIPWQAVVPTWILALALMAVTVVLVRRQLPSVRISGVLRARDE